MEKKSSKSSTPSTLPLLANAKPSARLELFAKKLRFCCYKYSFDDENANVKEKELKRIYLNECIEFVEETRGILIEPIYAMSFAMIAHNIFRTLRPPGPTYDPDEDDPIQDPSWPHLELVYTFFLRVLESPDFQPNEAKSFLDHSFVGRLIDMFCSDDINELDSLKTALHRIYGKFLGLRAFIRRELSHKFLEFIYEDLHFPGATEILEVLGSIINGYACPLKEEHIQFLFQILLPLHTSPKLQRFQPQLVYCVVQYLEKEPTLTEKFITKFLKLWPKTLSTKEVMFLGELEELIDVMTPSEFMKVQTPIFRQIAKCVGSEHFQVAERALYFWDNEYIVSLMEVSSPQIYPLILPSLLQASNFHWNKTIVTMSKNVLNDIMSDNQKAFQQMVANVKVKKKATQQEKLNREQKWRELQKLAEINMPPSLCSSRVNNVSSSFNN